MLIKKRPVVLVGIVVILVAGIALVVRILIQREECSRACPNQKTQSFSEVVKVDGSAPLFALNDGLAVRHGYALPVATEIIEAIRGPGVGLSRDTSRYGGAGLDKQLIVVGTSTDPRWSGCDVFVWRVNAQYVDAYRHRLTAKRLDSLRAGSEALFLVDMFCEPV